LLIKQKINIAFENFIHKDKNGFILKNIKYPPLVGLKDINSFCFMNSILQCFSHITKFVEFFKKDNRVLEVIENNKNNNHLILSSSFKYLIDNLLPSENDLTINKYVHNNDSNKYFCPYNIKDKIEKMNDQLNSLKINTSKDLITLVFI
jgi:ubiquitin C-terminal hydrolase